ncbi:MAG: DUF58 domain-containing protein [Verrucomicrobia bacterium]|nr:DUF58 domain-containing protein [Verrucomicrobiota bacterium]
MTRLIYRLYRLLTWLNYWVPRRFTPTGLLVLISMAVGGAVGMDMDQSMSFQVFLLAFCLLAVSISAACFFRGRFVVERALPRFASVGQPVAYPIKVSNRTAKTFRGLELLEGLTDPRPTLAEFTAARKAAARGRSFRLSLAASPSLNVRQATVKPVSLPVLPPNGEAETQVEVIPLRRGLLRFTGATVARPNAFGLFRAFARVSAPGKVLVLPKRYPLPALALPGARKYQQGGVALASAIGQSDEFVALRDYRPGDPMRHIHWRSWARAGRPIVREFQDEFFVRHALILDTFAGTEKGAAFEEAVSVAASFACSLDTQESLLDLMFVGPQAIHFTVGRGVSHVEQALEILASVRACPEKPFQLLRDLVLEHAGQVCGGVCLFLDWDEPRRELVRRLRALGLPMLVLVVADEDLDKKLQSQYSGQAPEGFRVLRLGEIAEGLRSL